MRDNKDAKMLGEKMKKVLDAVSSPEKVDLKALAEVLHETSTIVMDAYNRSQESARQAAELSGEAEPLLSRKGTGAGLDIRRNKVNIRDERIDKAKGGYEVPTVPCSMVVHTEAIERWLRQVEERQGLSVYQSTLLQLLSRKRYYVTHQIVQEGTELRCRSCGRTIPLNSEGFLDIEEYLAKNGRNPHWAH